MNSRWKKKIPPILLCAALLLAAGAPAACRAAESGEFKGTWVANGTRTIFPFGGDRQVYTFEVSGHVNLETTLGRKKDYWARCVGLSDSVTGSVGRCVWKDLDGPEIYLTLHSDRLQQESRVTGAIVGGTGPLAGIGGEISFVWSSVTFLAEAEGVTSMTGQTLDLRGAYRIP